jgi:hypothetical protein
VNVLIEQAAQTDGVQPHAPLLGPHVWIDVEQTACVAIHMAHVTPKLGWAVLRSSVGLNSS